MNKKPLLIGLILLVILGVGAYAFSQPQSGKIENSAMEKTENAIIAEGEDTTTDKSDSTMMNSNERYAEYSPDAYQAASGNRRVLFFYANWCPTCRPADTAFRENRSQIPEDVVLFRVNYNDTDTDQAEKDLAAKHGITYQHTYVQVDVNGNAVTTWNGGQINELLENIQ